MSDPARVQLKRGSLYLSRDLCDRFFPGLEAVVLLRRGDDLSILPVKHAAAGGYILKRRNGAGDRVVNAPDFFRSHGLDDLVEQELEVSWVAESASLVARSTFT